MMLWLSTQLLCWVGTDVNTPTTHRNISQRSTWWFCSMAFKKGWHSLGAGGPGGDLWKGTFLEPPLEMHSWEETLHARGDTVQRHCSHGWPTLGQGHPRGTGAVGDACQSGGTPEGLWPLEEPTREWRKQVRRKQQWRKRLRSKESQKENIMRWPQPPAALVASPRRLSVMWWMKLSLGKGEEMCFPKCLSSYLHGKFFPQYPNQ